MTVNKMLTSVFRVVPDKDPVHIPPKEGEMDDFNLKIRAKIDYFASFLKKQN